MLEKLKLIKYPAKLFLWSWWLSIQVFELIVSVIFEGFMSISNCIYYMTESCYKGIRLREIGSEITTVMSYCKEEFFRRLHSVRHPVCVLSGYYGIGDFDRYSRWGRKCSNLLLKLFLVLGFNPNAGFPLSQITKAYDKKGLWFSEDDIEYQLITSTFLRRVELLIEYGADINCKTTEDHPLKLFIRREWLNELDFLIKKGADVNSQLFFRRGGSCSPLQYASNWGSVDSVLFLIYKGADFRYSDIPRIFGNHEVSTYKSSKILCAIYNGNTSELPVLLQDYKDMCSEFEWENLYMKPIFHHVLRKYILPKVQDEQIKEQLNNFISGTDNSVEDISVQAGTPNSLQNFRERQDEVVTIENISKAQRETEGLSISSN